MKRIYLKMKGESKIAMNNNLALKNSLMCSILFMDGIQSKFLQIWPGFFLFAKHFTDYRIVYCFYRFPYNLSKVYLYIAHVLPVNIPVLGASSIIIDKMANGNKCNSMIGK